MLLKISRFLVTILLFDGQQLIMSVVPFYFIYYIVAVRDSDVKFFF